MRIHPLPLILTGLLLASCESATDGTTTDENISSSSSSDAPIVETHNVSFIGTIRPAGISIYMEGTHRLELGDGRFILLSSDTVDLNGYVGEIAEVTGTIRPTIEEGGTIMRVEQIRLEEKSSSSVSSAVAASSSSPSSETSSAMAAVSSATSSMLAASASQQSVAASSTATTVDVSAQVTSMAKQDFATSNWTQAYCAPPTIGFCVPIHRNWYFKSFGSATEALWHLEIGSQEVENTHDGSIAVNLMGGSLASEGVGEGDVRDDGTTVRGYREWSKDRHIEISAPSALKEAVSYMTEHLSAMEAVTGT